MRESVPEVIEENTDLALVVGRLTKVIADLRRANMTAVAACEDFLGINSRVCRHCGRPVNRG